MFLPTINNEIGIKFYSKSDASVVQVRGSTKLNNKVGDEIIKLARN